MELKYEWFSKRKGKEKKCNKKDLVAEALSERIAHKTTKMVPQNKAKMKIKTLGKWI